MTTIHPPFRIWSDQLEILQNNAYIAIDYRRVESVYYNEGWMTVRYKVQGEVVLDCTKIETPDMKLLLHTLESQRVRHRDQIREKNAAGAFSSGVY